jgi:tRNA-dihydrouridine synthase
MIARGAMNNPMIFSEILGIKPQTSFKDLIKKHLSLLVERYGSERSAVVFRKQMAFYLKGLRDSKRLKEKVFSATDSKEIFEVIESIED